MCVTVKTRLYCAVGSAVLPVSLLLMKNVTCFVFLCLYMDLSKREWNIWFEVIESEVYKSTGPLLL